MANGFRRGSCACSYGTAGAAEVEMVHEWRQGGRPGEVGEV